MNNNTRTLTPAGHLEEIIIRVTKLKYELGNAFKHNAGVAHVLSLMEEYNSLIEEMETLHDRLYEVE